MYFSIFKMASNAKVVFSLPTVTEPSINGSFPQIDNLEYFPEKVLLLIFSEVGDWDLLHLSDCSYRFDGIAKIAFKRRYARQYFVFDDDTETKRKMNRHLFQRFGRYANIKAVEVKGIHHIDENHWIAKLLLQHTKQLEKLKFYRCWFKGINEILSQHMNITHLTIRLSIWNNPFDRENYFLGMPAHPLEAPNYRLKIPNYRNLKQLEVSDNDRSSICDESTIVRAMRNNPELEMLNLSRCRPIVPIDCIAKHLKYLKELNVICSIGMLNGATMNFVVDSLKHLESLRLTISENQHMDLVKRLSLKCKNLKQLELDHNRYDETVSSDEIIRTAAQFQAVESLEFSLLKDDNSLQTVAECLPAWQRLRHLEVFMDKPQHPNTFVPSLLNASSTLKTITINTWNVSTLSSLPGLFLSRANLKEMIKTFLEPIRLRNELKEFQLECGFVRRKEIIRCDERSHRTGNNSIFFSFRMVFSCFNAISTIVIGFIVLLFHIIVPPNYN